MKAIPGILAGLLLLYNAAKAQQNFQDDYNSRVIGISKLWGYVKYFHPRLARNDPGWDSAFASIAPQVLHVKTDEEYIEVLNTLLSVLQDHTSFAFKSAPFRADRVPKAVSALYDKDSLLIVKIPDPDVLADWDMSGEIFDPINAKIKKSKGVIFDLRAEKLFQGKASGEIDWYFEYVFAESLITRETALPVKDYRIHFGFKTESGWTSGGYYSTYLPSEEKVLSPVIDQEKKVVFIINENSELPDLAYPLQLQGQAAILSKTDIIERAFRCHVDIQLFGEVSVRMKNAQFRYMNAPVHFFSNETYTSDEEAYRKAYKFLRGEKISKDQRKSIAPAPAKKVAAYPAADYPDVGYRMLAAAKIYAVINYFFPYKDLMDENWDDVFAEFLPKVIASTNEREYISAVAEYYSHLNDMHGFISGQSYRRLAGEAAPTFWTQIVEGEVVIGGFHNDSTAVADGFVVGDVVLEVNGEDIKVRMKERAKYFSASTPQFQQRRSSLLAIRDEAGKAMTFTVRSENGKIKTLSTIPKAAYARMPKYRKGPSFKLLPRNIGYVDLDRLTIPEIDTMFESLRNTRAIIFDMRGYPEPTGWKIASRLTEKNDVLVSIFKTPVVAGSDFKSNHHLWSRHFQEFGQTVDNSDQWKYKKQTVMLINEFEGSRAEGMGLLLEAVNNTLFIGSPTLGTNGDVTRFQIPGGITLTLSGRSVSHADGRQLQRIGIQPHVPVAPTIKGIQSGKDEVLQKAIEWINNNVE